MNQKDIYIGAFAYELGENDHVVDQLEELSGRPEQVDMLKKAGFSGYMTSDLTVLDLAGKSIEKLFASCTIDQSAVDAVIFATSSMGVSNHLSHHFLSEFLIRHNLEKAYPLISSLSFCGNFLPALEKAYHYLQNDDFRNILVVVSDIVPKKNSRLAPPDVALGSDGSACCLLSTTPFSGLTISGIHHAVDAHAGIMDPARDFARYVKAVGNGIRSVTSKSLQYNGTSTTDITSVFTNNYSINTCKGYLRLIQVPDHKIDLANVARFGHAGAADICINLCDYLEQYDTKPEDVFLLLSSGPFMWGSAVLRRV